MKRVKNKGFWRNPEGFLLRKDVELSTPAEAVYEFRLDYLSPLTYVSNMLVCYQPNKHYFTDMGSIPRLAQAILPKDRYLGYYLHDSGYIEHGLWVNGEFWEMTRKQVDDLLFESILNDPLPGSWLQAKVIWLAVRMFGGWAWNRKAQ